MPAYALFADDIKALLVWKYSLMDFQERIFKSSVGLTFLIEIGEGFVKIKGIDNFKKLIIYLFIKALSEIAFKNVSAGIG